MEVVIGLLFIGTGFHYEVLDGLKFIRLLSWLPSSWSYRYALSTQFLEIL